MSQKRFAPVTDRKAGSARASIAEALDVLRQQLAAKEDVAKTATSTKDQLDAEIIRDELPAVLVSVRRRSQEVLVS